MLAGFQSLLRNSGMTDGIFAGFQKLLRNSGMMDKRIENSGMAGL
jgi:hypothetical protein